MSETLYEYAQSQGIVKLNIGSRRKYNENIEDSKSIDEKKIKEKPKITLDDFF